ncbi:MAG: DNA replication/repair protein RecF [Parachlamydiaceae bacterium]|nr:DNA replication/repair protein RecF [Parachlamydiaceae bacterium]
MHLRSLYLHNFRIYEEAFYEFGPKINVISGPNARGKTSILEAIYFLMTGRSFRQTQVSDMIRHGASSFYIEASFIKHGIEQTLRVHCSGKDRRIVYNNTLCASSSDLLGLLLGAVIHPDDATVVKGAPEARRHLLDVQIAQANPLYIHHLTRYNRAMRQRNHLLRAKTAATIESWEHEMANSAAYIVYQRLQTIEDLQEKGQRLHNLICGGNDTLELAYKSAAVLRSISVADIDILQLRTYYLEQYSKQRKREMELGVTLIGPHKDDVFIGLNTNEARFFASEGQQRSCVAALRLAEWECLKANSYEMPLMLIDDVGMSLDYSRRTRLFSHLPALEQVFLTTTEELNLPGNTHTISV